MNSVISLICVNVHLPCNHTKEATWPSMQDFMVLKAFNITIHHAKAPRTVKVIWQPPLVGFDKI